MRTLPTRAETRESNLYSAAERGSFFLSNVQLYGSEIRKLQKDGFDLTIEGTFNPSKRLQTVMIDWRNPFRNGIPNDVYAYLIGKTETEPKKSIQNFAQKLYVIACKANQSVQQDKNFC